MLTGRPRTEDEENLLTQFIVLCSKSSTELNDFLQEHAEQILPKYRPVYVYFAIEQGDTDTYDIVNEFFLFEDVNFEPTPRETSMPSVP